MSYKLIVLDLDDTLLQDDHTISTRTKQALITAQEEGVKVVLASGRPDHGMYHIAEELQLKKYGSYILAFNGAKIINLENDELIFSSTLSPETVHRLYELSHREDVWIHTYMGKEIITEASNQYTEVEAYLTGLDIVEVGSFVGSVTEPVVKVLMMEEPEKLAKVEEKLKQELTGELSVMRSKPFFLEFTEEGVTKGTSLEQLTNQMGLTREEVIAIGDSYNDLTMIEFAGLGVAMGNAPEDIKEKADFITDSNMEDGVAKVIEKFVLKSPILVD